MKLRKMTEYDIDNVYDIERSVNEFPWSLQQLLGSLQNDNESCVVSCDINIITGYSIFSVVLDEATLLNIAVSPDYQRRGIAKSLLQEGLQTLNKQGVSNCYLEVRKSNKKAISLYQTNGFEQIGERKSYYPAFEGREDAWVMRRQMPTTELGKI